MLGLVAWNSNKLLNIASANRCRVHCISIYQLLTAVSIYYANDCEHAHCTLSSRLLLTRCTSLHTWYIVASISLVACVGKTISSANLFHKRMSGHVSSHLVFASALDKFFANSVARCEIHDSCAIWKVSNRSFCNWACLGSKCLKSVTSGLDEKSRVCPLTSVDATL